MNQIPNIDGTPRKDFGFVPKYPDGLPNIEEEMVKNLTYHLRVAFKPVAKESWWSSAEDYFLGKLRKALTAQEQTHHQQLQKARQDWLREEIVKLEGMKEDEPPHAGYTRVEASMYSYAKGKNQAIQIIINRYQKELKQEISK